LTEIGFLTILSVKIESMRGILGRMFDDNRTGAGKSVCFNEMVDNVLGGTLRTRAAVIVASSSGP